MPELKRILLDETDSTNNYAKTIAPHENGDLIIIAEKQTAGRGRTGRRFFSPEGGVYMSLLLHPRLDPERADMITVMAAVAAARAIEKVFDVKPFIKWVNDIFVNNKKVCGILTEGVFDPANGKFRYAVLGVGVNLSFPKGGFPEDIKDIAGSVCERATKEQKNRFIDEFICEFYGVYENGREYLDEYRRRSNLIGKRIEYTKGNETKTGRAIDITDDGALAVEEEKGVTYLRSGEVKISMNFIKNIER